MIFTEVEFRDGGSIRVFGYVNAVGRDSRVLPATAARGADSPFVEQVTPGAFAAAIADNPDVRLFFNHERDIGGAASGELRLREDSIGLFADAVVTDPEIIDAAKKGELRGWSFGFSEARARWEPAGNSLKRRRLDGFKLFEVSILTKTPAYPGTSVELRGWSSGLPREWTIERRFAADNFTAQPAQFSQTTQNAQSAQPIPTQAAQAVQPAQAAQTVPSGDYYRATVRVLELSAGAFPVLPLTNGSSRDTMEERKKNNWVKGSKGYFAGSVSNGRGGRAKITKSEYMRVSSAIATNYPFLKVDGVSHTFYHGEHRYKFTVVEFGTYIFHEKFKLE